MNQTGANDWKTPLGYYERAISELRKTQEEFQTELQNLRQLQDSYAILKAELQVTKEQLETTQKATNEFEVRATTAEKVANDAQTELQTIKAELQATKAEIQATVEKTANDAQTELQNFKANLQPVRLESGIFSGNVKITPGWKGVLCCEHQGKGRFIRKYIRFSQPFSTSPNIVLGLSYVDVYQGANHRIKVIATDVDTHGFFLEIHTWRDTQVWGADVNWLAYGY